MCAHQSEMAPKRDRGYVKALLEKRLATLHRQELRLDDPTLKDFYISQEAILEEVLRRAHGHSDDESLIRIIDMYILESRRYKQITDDRGLRTFFGIKVRVLRAARRLIGRYLRSRRWMKRGRKGP